MATGVTGNVTVNVDSQPGCAVVLALSGIGGQGEVETFADVQMRPGEARLLKHMLELAIEDSESKT